MRHDSSTIVRSVLLGAVSVFGLAASGAAWAQTGMGNTPAAPSTPADAVAAPATVNKADVEVGKARHDEGFGKGRVQPLVGDAVAVKNDPVAVPKREIGGGVLRAAN